MFTPEPNDGVRVQCVFVPRRGSESGLRDLLIGILPETETDDFRTLLNEDESSADHAWTTRHLRGPGEPYAVWPSIDVVFAVTSGGIKGEHRDTGRGQFVDAVFTDLAMARSYADVCAERDTYVLEVPLGERLPIPDAHWEPTSEDQTKCALRQRVASRARNAWSFPTWRGETRYAIEGPDWGDVECIGSEDFDVALQPRLDVMQGVMAYLAFPICADDESNSAVSAQVPSLAAKSIEEIVDAVPQLIDTTANGHIEWEMHDLRGSDAPYTMWPETPALNVVLDGSGTLGVFVDRASAEAYAARHTATQVEVRSVPDQQAVLEEG